MEMEAPTYEQPTARAGLGATVADGKIYVCGGHDGESPVKTLQVFEPGDELDSPGTWIEMPPMLARRTYLQTVSLENRVFAIGGSADGRTLNTIEVFDPEENAWGYWFTMPPMQTKRTLHGSAVGNGRVFVCGGFDGMRDMNTTECYDPRTNAWTTKSSWNLKEGRSYLALCHCGDTIFAIGGQDRSKDDGPRAHPSVEAFNLYSERWLPEADLETGRLGLSASSLVHDDGDKYIYACGGSNGSDVLASVERFSMREHTWSNAPPMSSPRLGHAAVVLKNRLYVIGGYDGKEPLDTFECFDPKLEKWGPPVKIPMPAKQVIEKPLVKEPEKEIYRSCNRQVITKVIKQPCAKDEKPENDAVANAEGVKRLNDRSSNDDTMN